MIQIAALRSRLEKSAATELKEFRRRYTRIRIVLGRLIATAAIGP
jgi:hypothetical protein